MFTKERSDALKVWSEIKKAGFYDLPNENYTPLPIAQGLIFVFRIMICFSGWAAYWLALTLIHTMNNQLLLLGIQLATYLFLLTFSWLVIQNKISFPWFVIMITTLVLSSAYWRIVIGL
jgi:hypothetical protein